MRYGTNKGLAGVLITITRNGQIELLGEPDAVTDASGRFTIRNAAPGAYTIHAVRWGYLAPTRNGVELEDGGAKQKIVVELGKALSLAFALSPASALGGRVFEAGEFVLRFFGIERRHIVGNERSRGDDQAIVVHHFDHYLAASPLLSNADLSV